ncbi:MAG: KaiC domain-containing protein [Candidatus Latescibacterota bacterium]|nr:MAG: KaiC domain-containing protein [Candidatus Latescibacterota bacterium]HDI00029.1 KaiC domain-containing protein [Bacillota bacterium]
MEGFDPKEAVKVLGEYEGQAPEVLGIPTSTGLDGLFYRLVRDGEGWRREPLNGIPFRSVINLTGEPDTGKSVLVEQFAAYQAGRGYKVCFVTVEAPAQFLFGAVRSKAEVLGLSFDDVQENLVVVDAAGNPAIRENLYNFLETLKYAVEKFGTKSTVIDSVTGLYEHREIMARQVVRAVFNELKKLGQTAILVSQKRSAQSSESAEAAGGLAVAHIVDGTIVMGKVLITNRWEAQLYGTPIGSVVRTIRIDGCRMVPHDPRTWVFRIDERGLIELTEPLEDLISRAQAKEVRKSAGGG